MVLNINKKGLLKINKLINTDGHVEDIMIATNMWITEFMQDEMNLKTLDKILPYTSMEQQDVEMEMIRIILEFQFEYEKEQQKLTFDRMYFTIVNYFNKLVRESSYMNTEENDDKLVIQD
jgi:hypothetical protein